MFDKIKKYYDCGLYTKKHVRDFCNKGVITPEQYESITGELFATA